MTSNTNLLLSRLLLVVRETKVSPLSSKCRAGLGLNRLNYDTQGYRQARSNVHRRLGLARVRVMMMIRCFLLRKKLLAR